MPARLYRLLRQAEQAIERASGGPIPEAVLKQLRRWLAIFYELGRAHRHWEDRHDEDDESADR